MENGWREEGLWDIWGGGNRESGIIWKKIIIKKKEKKEIETGTLHE